MGAQGFLPPQPFLYYMIECPPEGSDQAGNAPKSAPVRGGPL